MWLMLQRRVGTLVEKKTVETDGSLEETGMS